MKVDVDFNFPSFFAFSKEDLFDIGVSVAAAATDTSVPLAPQSDVHIHK